MAENFKGTVEALFHGMDGDLIQDRGRRGDSYR